MSTELVGSSAKGTLSAVLSSSKAFAVAHPMGMAVAGGALLGIVGYKSMGRYLSKRKQKKENIKAALETVAAQTA